MLPLTLIKGLESIYRSILIQKIVCSLSLITFLQMSHFLIDPPVRDSNSAFYSFRNLLTVDPAHNDMI